jgi:hypothetical protein
MITVRAIHLVAAIVQVRAIRRAAIQVVDFLMIGKERGQ